MPKRGPTKKTRAKRAALLKTLEEDGHAHPFARMTARNDKRVMREWLKELNGASTLELKREAVRQGMKTLRMSALTKLKEGATTLDEVGRVTAND